MTTPRELQSLYEQGTNITRLLREEKGLESNSDEIIEIAYDLQTGSYVAAMDDETMAQHKKDYTAEIVRTIMSLREPTSVMEAGVGEATTLSGVLRELPPEVSGFGFDLSWSRVAYAKNWLQSQGLSQATLCTGNLFHIPFADNSIDIVYTSHSIEPNGGHEEPILRELFRVARRFLILMEPGYELANEEAKRRMERHGYCRNLTGVADALGYKVLSHELFPFTANPLNPTAITIIEKQSEAPPAPHVLACPMYKTPLMELGGAFYSPEALVVYPIIGGIPCLRRDNGIFASKYVDVLRGS